MLNASCEASALKVIADKESFGRNQKELAHIEIMVTDKNGHAVYNAENEISIAIDGPAILLGMENGSVVSHEDYKAAKHKAWHGQLLAYIQSTKKPGAIKIKITSPGLTEQLITIKN